MIGNPVHGRQTGGFFSLHGLASSKAAQAARTVSSAPAGADDMQNLPAGPRRKNPQGMLAAVAPIMLMVGVKGVNPHNSATFLPAMNLGANPTGNAVVARVWG